MIGIPFMNTSIINAETSSLNEILARLETNFASGKAFHLQGKYYIVSLETSVMFDSVNCCKRLVEGRD